jgi:hypothetical protein
MLHKNGPGSAHLDLCPSASLSPGFTKTRSPKYQVECHEELKVMQVGFIGLGSMGSGMAANLLEAGHALTVYNRTPARAEALVAEGARLAKTPRRLRGATWSSPCSPTMLRSKAWHLARMAS